MAHPDRGARRHAVARRALPRAAAADLERGAVAAAAVGPAVVAAAAADPRVRDRPARVRRSVRGQPGDRGEGRRRCATRRAPSSRGSPRSAASSGAIETGYCKQELVRSMAARMARIERGEQIVVGVNKWTEALPSPLVGGDDGGVFQRRSARRPTRRSRRSSATRATRDAARAARRARARSRRRRAPGEPIMEASIECALARVTTGEWAGTLREVWGEYRAQTGVAGASHRRRRRRLGRAARARRGAAAAGPKLLVGKPGLDGHSQRRRGDRGRGARRRLRGDLRRHPARARRDRRRPRSRRTSTSIGLSVLSGSHVELTRGGARRARARAARRTCRSWSAAPCPRAITPRCASSASGACSRRADYKLVEIVGALVDLCG